MTPPTTPITPDSDFSHSLNHCTIGALQEVTLEGLRQHQTQNHCDTDQTAVFKVLGMRMDCIQRPGPPAQTANQYPKGKSPDRTRY